MREYQLEGLAWMSAQFDRGMNAILADEMGLGKTLQSIAFLAHLKWERNVPGPHLVVVPLSVLASWVSEFKRWCPEMRVVRLHATDDDERRRLKRDVLSDPSQFDVAVTTYDMVNSAHFGGALKSTLVWRYLVLDEGHKIKNEATLTCQGMRAVARQHVLLLTGTPLQNSMRELYVLLNFLYPDVFTDGAPFDGAFDPQRHRVDDARLAQAHYLLRPLCLRRLKEEVEQRLPPKVETRISCPLSEYQTFWYRRLLTRDAKLLERIEREARGGGGGAEGGGEGGGEDGGAVVPAAAAAASAPASADGSAWQRLMNLVMQLRKVVDHPFLFPDSEPEGGAGLEEVIEASGEVLSSASVVALFAPRGVGVVVAAATKKRAKTKALTISPQPSKPNQTPPQNNKKHPKHHKKHPQKPQNNQQARWACSTSSCRSSSPAATASSSSASSRACSTSSRTT
jgi:SWI/SNF-related matrix-associated actin-dependent regulator of chromatin subfamily A member 5